MERIFTFVATQRSFSLLFGSAIACLTLAACGGTGDADDDGSSGSGGSSQTAGSAGRGESGKGGGGSAGTDSVACTTRAEPSRLVEVESGEFMMGCNEEVDGDCDSDEKPLHVVSLSAFEIERTEVTQAQYSACVLDGACEPPSCPWDCEKTDYPAGCVNRASAENYCAWASRRLPTEAEWEKAARGSDGQKYPWGNDEPDCSLANFSECGGVAQPVGSAPDGESPYGALDMAGNVVEMVADRYDANYYEVSPETDPAGPESGDRYGGRGGGYRSDPEWQRASKRDWYDSTDMSASLGFRCAR